MLAVPFPFRMHACTISNWAWSFDMQKNERPARSLPTRIDNFLLLQSSKLFWGSSLLPLFNFERVLRLRLDWVWSPLWTIDRPRVANRLIASKCDRLDRAMLLLAFLGSWGIIFVLATIGIVDCTFHCVGLRLSRFHSCVWGTAVLLPSRRGGTEQKRYPFFDCYCRSADLACTWYYYLIACNRY